MFEGINIESYIDVVNDMDLLFLASHFVTHAPQVMNLISSSIVINRNSVP